MRFLRGFAACALFVVPAAGATAQTETNIIVLGGLAAVTALEATDAGKAALAANLAVTGAIQDGGADQPTLLPFSEQQQLALRDAFITHGNASELADGLGTALGNAYQSGSTYTSTDDGKTTSFTNVTPSMAPLIAYALATTWADADVAKYFFANGTLDKTTPASAAAMGILKEIRGTTDIFGKAYNRPAGGAGAGAYGDSRPFQTEPHLITYAGRDFFGVASSNAAYLRGPSQNLTNSPSYPSGHTTYGSNT